MIALHARRSAASIAAFRERCANPIALVLTGTDLYRDLAQGGDTVRSIDAADRLVVLQEDALSRLTPRWRGKCEVIFQSARAIRHRGRPNARLDCVVVGHLREEKDPLTLLRAVEMLPRDAPFVVRHIGAPLDPELGKAAQAMARRDARYRYLGAQPHGLTRTAMASSDLLIHPSIMEGGANVIVEAIMSDTPIVASRISGNLGMLGERHPGYFEARDAAGLSAALRRAIAEPGYLRTLRNAAKGRKPLFQPAVEARALRKLVERLLA